MPQAVALLLLHPLAAAGIGGAIWTSALTLPFATFIVSVGLAVGLGAAAKALSKKKGGALTLDANKRTITVREPLSPRQVIYGRTRVGGTLTFIHSTDDNQVLYMTITLTGHEVNAIGDIYFDDELVPLDANGDATGRLAGLVTIKKGLGSTAGDAAWLAWKVAEVPTKWTTDHKQEGCAKITAKLKWDNNAWKTGIPNITAVVDGKKVFDPRDSLTKYSPNAALVFRDYLTDSDFGIGEPAARINDTDATAAANICEEKVNLASKSAQFTADATSDVLTLVASGIPPAIDIKRMNPGDVVQLTTNGTLPAGLATVTDYFVIPITATTLKLASTLQNAFDGVAVDFTDAGTGTHTLERRQEPRYLCNGAFTVDKTPEEIAGALLASMGGFASHFNGNWSMFAAAYRSPVYTLTEADIIAPMRIAALVSRRDLFNRVKGVFVSPQDLYQPTDFPAVVNSTYLAEDGGEELFTDLELEFTQSPSAAQRLGKIELEKVRQQISVEVVVHFKWFALQIGDTVNLTNDRMGWTAKPFEVVNLRLATSGEGDSAGLAVRLFLRETASGVYDWNNGEETTVDPAPDTDLPDPFNIDPPGNLMLESGNDFLFIAPSGGTVISRIQATWDAPNDALIDGYEVQFKKATAADWPESTTPVDVTSVLLGPVEDGVEYDVRVRARNVLGTRSAWVTEFDHTVIGKTAPPSPPDTFNIEVQADGTRRYSWTDQTPDPDVKVGGGYKIRWFLGSTTNWGAMNDLHTGILLSSPYESNELAAGTYTLAIKSVDSSGNESTDPVFISSAALGDPRIENALLQRNERIEAWPGTKTDGFVYHNGDLVATSSQTIADLPGTIAGLASSIEAMVTSNSPMVYETPTIDLGQDFNIKPLVSVSGSGTHTVTMQTGTDSDGAPVGSFVAPAVVTARYIKIKVSTAGTTPRLGTMLTVIDSPAKVETYDDVNTASATDPWFESIAAGHFKIETRGNISQITQANITALQNVGAGYTWELISKSTTLTGGSLPAAEFKVYDSTGTLADATVDVLLRGAKV